MPTDVEDLRADLGKYLQRVKESYRDDTDPDLACYITPEEVGEMLDEIEQLRAQVAEVEEQLRVLADGSEEDDLVILPTPISFEVIERYTKAMKGNIMGTETRPDLAGTESDVDA